MFRDRVQIVSAFELIGHEQTGRKKRGEEDDAVQGGPQCGQAVSRLRGWSC